LRQWLLKYFCIAWIAANTVIFFPWAMLLELLRYLGGGGSMGFVQNTWTRLMLWAPGARLEVEGKQHLDAERTTVFVSNHQSTLDIPALLLAVSPTEVRFVAKKIIKYVPLFGWYMAFAGFVFIDRANKRAGMQSLKDAAARISRGTSIIIFPEGTRSETGEILPFKKGTFALATMAGVSICPVAIDGSRVVMPKARWDVKPGIIRVKIGAPIDPKPFGSDREALARVVRDRIIDLHREIGGVGGDKANAIDRPERQASARPTATDEGVEA
jgi:1-acyl-sn-glycerol-3-phosphate acyltransferase